MGVSQASQEHEAAGLRKPVGLGNAVVGWFALYAAALWMGTWFALRTQVGADNLTVLWLPTGLTFGAMLLTRRRYWPVLLLISAVVYVGYAWASGKVSGSVADLVYYAVVGDAAMWAGAELFWWGRGRAVRLERVGDVGWLFAVVLATTGAGAAASVRLKWAGEAQIDWWREFQLWWFADALGCVAVMPWMLAFLGRGWGAAVRTESSVRFRSDGGRRLVKLEAALILLSIVGLAWFTVTLPRPASSVQLPILLCPVLVWSAVRFGRRLNTTALVLLVILFAVQIDRGVGPFVAGNGADKIGALRMTTAALQVYLLATVFGVLILSTVVQERQRAATKLRENAEQFNTLMSTLRPTVWLMQRPTAILTYVSKSFARLADREPESMLGRPGAWREIVHPEDRALTDASLTRMIEQGYDDTEYRIVRTDGTVRWVRELTAAVKSEDGEIQQLAGSVEDVTHRHRAAAQRDALEAELSASNERYRDFMRITGEAVWRAEFDAPVSLDQSYDDFEDEACRGRVAECNQRFAEMFGARRVDDIVGRRVTDFFPLRDRGNQVYRAFFNQECRAIAAEVCDDRPADGPRWYLASFAGVVEDRKLVRIWGTRRDITQSRRLLEKLREAQKLEAVGQLAAGVAHDFNNLLAVISAHTELLEGRVEPDAQVTSSLVAVREAVDHAAGVSRSLMTFNQTLPVRRESVDPAAVIQQTCRMVARSIPEGVTLERDLPDTGLPRVTGDAVQLQQVLINLVLNARDALGEAGGTITVAAEADGAVPAAGLRLAVQDNGRGMDEETRRRVFEPFFTTKGDTGGTGLGLAVVHGIVADHGGQIAVSSRLGHGTTVTVELPGTKDTPEAAAPQSPAVAADGADPSSGPSILLAEDDHQVRGVIASALQARGYRVFPVADADALRRVYDQSMVEGQPIDLIVTDVDMPGGSGLHAVRQLRARGDQTPAVIVTGSVMVELDPLRDINMVLMNKPFGIGGLCDAVQAQLAEHDPPVSPLPGE